MTAFKESQMFGESRLSSAKSATARKRAAMLGKRPPTSFLLPLHCNIEMTRVHKLDEQLVRSMYQIRPSVSIRRLHRTNRRCGSVQNQATTAKILL